MGQAKPYPQTGAEHRRTDSTTNPPAVRAETVDGLPQDGASHARAVMTAIRARVCRYRCGTCEYESTDQWGAHEAHYRGHRDSR